MKRRPGLRVLEGGCRPQAKCCVCEQGMGHLTRETAGRGQALEGPTEMKFICNGCVERIVETAK